MAALLCLVLFMYLTSISTAQTTDCLHLREQCISAANGCENVWNVVEDACNISEPTPVCPCPSCPLEPNTGHSSPDVFSQVLKGKTQYSSLQSSDGIPTEMTDHLTVQEQRLSPFLGNRCKAEDTIGCNRIIQVLADEYPEFKNCVCTTKDFCSIMVFLGKQCSTDKEHFETSSKSDTELSFRQQRYPKDQRHPEDLEKDCSIAKQCCQEDPHCFLVYKSFQQACQADAEKCRLPVVNQECLRVWKELRKTELGECKCSDPLQMRCLKILKRIFNKPCLQYSEESQPSAMSEYDDDNENDDDDDDDDGDKNQDTDTDAISTETKLQWRLSSLSKQAYTANRTCLDVNKECVEDEVCNKQLSLYLKVCSVNKKCNMEECQAAIRFFYQNMPFEIAQMMTFCDCTELDESCHRAKELLHGKPCAVTAVPPPSCLNVIHMCEENEMCREKYETFQSKCWRHVTKKCYQDEACLETLIKGDMPCSANTDCKAAYISNWGTVLQMECTCQNLAPMEQSLCKLFHHMLHSKSCFRQLRQISIKKKGFPWVNTEMPRQKLSRAHLHSSSISGETVYIVAYSSCIVLILGIVLLILLKLRACRAKHESRSPSPDQSTETFMVHYKSHR